MAETVSKDDLVKRDLECRDLVDEAKDYLLLPPEKRQLLNGKRMERRMATRSLSETRSGILFAGNLSVVNFTDNLCQVVCALFSGRTILQWHRVICGANESKNG